MIERTFDVAHVNGIVNHPDVLPWVSPDGKPQDCKDLIANRDNYAVFGQYGGAIFVKIQPHVYEIHVQVLPEGRGGWTKGAIIECFDWIFFNSDCNELVARCPRGNLACLTLIRMMGGKFKAYMENGWLKNGQPIPADIYSWRFDDWVRRTLWKLIRCH